MLVHILHANTTKFKCGVSYVPFHPQGESFVVWRPKEAEWLESSIKPTCETCILLHWTDPNNTYAHK